MNKIKNLALLFTFFFSTAVMPSQDLADIIKSGDAQSFVDQVPTTDMSALQEAIHQSIKEIDGNKKIYYTSSADMLSDLEKCITNEITYLESQIQNNHTYDRKALKFTAKSIVAASILTCGTYYFYKNWTLTSRKDLDLFKKNYGPRSLRDFNLEKEDLEEKYRIFTSIVNGFLEYYYISEKCFQEGEKLRKHQLLLELFNTTLISASLASYITTGYSSYQAYSLDPNRNNDSLSKYKQLLQLVILLKEVE